MHMRYGALITALACGFLGVAAGRPAAAAAQTTCPAEVARTRDNVARFLTSSNFASWRDQYGLSAVSPSRLVLLTDAQDASICQRLNNSVQPTPGPYPVAVSY